MTFLEALQLLQAGRWVQCANHDYAYWVLKLSDDGELQSSTYTQRPRQFKYSSTGFNYLQRYQWNLIPIDEQVQQES